MKLNYNMLSDYERAIVKTIADAKANDHVSLAYIEERVGGGDNLPKAVDYLILRRFVIRDGDSYDLAVF